MALLTEQGTYTARAVEHAFGRTSGGKDQVAVRFEITQDGPAKGRRLTWYGYFTDKTKDRTFESLEAAGWSGEALADMSGLGSCECAIVVAHEEDQEGMLRERVRWVNRIGGLALKEELSQADVLTLDRSLKGDLLAWKSSRKNQAPRQAPKQATKLQASRAFDDDSFDYGANELDDDIPL
jgi:hypothetical protein